MPRRGENIYKRKDGRWEARYIKTTELDGTKRYGSVYARTYREVKEKQRLMRDKPQAPSSGTVGELMDDWLNSVKPRLKPSSCQKYSSAVCNHIKPTLGDLPLKRVTSNIITRFTESLLSSGLSAQTANQVLLILGMGFKFARERCQAVLPDIKFLKTTKPKMRVFSPKEQNKLVKELLAKDDIFSFGILIALYTGLRVGELCALQWEDVSANTIHIRRTVQRLRSDSGKTELVFLSPKTSSSDRVIPIPKVILPMIDQRRRQSGYVLYQESGNPVEPRQMQRKFVKAVADCGIEKANFHALRHTFATRCIEAGVDVKTLSELLGHADVKTTLNKYVHSSFELKQISVDKLLIEV